LNPSDDFAHQLDVTAILQTSCHEDSQVILPSYMPKSAGLTISLALAYLCYTRAADTTDYYGLTQ
jgi:hypothetical protein